jgi:hypothetical protein
VRGEREIVNTASGPGAHRVPFRCQGLQGRYHGGRLPLRGEAASGDRWKPRPWLGDNDVLFLRRDRAAAGAVADVGAAHATYLSQVMRESAWSAPSSRMRPSSAHKSGLAFRPGTEAADYLSEPIGSLLDATGRRVIELRRVSARRPCDARRAAARSHGGMSSAYGVILARGLDLGSEFGTSEIHAPEPSGVRQSPEVVSPAPLPCREKSAAARFVDALPAGEQRRLRGNAARRYGPPARTQERKKNEGWPSACC